MYILTQDYSGWKIYTVNILSTYETWFRMIFSVILQLTHLYRRCSPAAPPAISLDKSHSPWSGPPGVRSVTGAWCSWQLGSSNLDVMRGVCGLYYPLSAYQSPISEVDECKGKQAEKTPEKKKTWTAKWKLDLGEASVIWNYRCRWNTCIIT